VKHAWIKPNTNQLKPTGIIYIPTLPYDYSAKCIRGSTTISTTQKPHNGNTNDIEGEECLPRQCRRAEEEEEEEEEQSNGPRSRGEDNAT